MSATLRGDRGSFGGAATPAQASPLRLGTLSARAASSALLSVGANGDVVAGALVAADIPSTFVQRGVNEPISGTWVWSAPITFVGPGMVPQPPQPTTRSTGTKIVLYPNVGAPEYAIGIENGSSWISTPASAAHKWYQGATERLRLDTDGTVRVINGSGTLQLDAAGGIPNGAVNAGATLYLNGLTGAIVLSTAATSNAIFPQANYKENLGLLNKKFLTLHAGELWVETLVAQDVMATIGGRILVGPTTQLTADLPAAGSGAPPAYQTGIQVKHNNLIPGDWVFLESAPGGVAQFEIGQIVYGPVGSPGAYGYLMNRNADGSGLRDWLAGDAVFNTGSVTSPPSHGFIDLYSVRGVKRPSTAGPTIVGNVRTDNTVPGTLGWWERWAIGNLKGLYGNATDIFGVAFGNPTAGLHVQIDSNMAAMGGGIRFLDAANTPYAVWDMYGTIQLGYPSAPNIYMTATGSLQMRNGSTVTMQLDAGSGNMSLIGNLRSGATSFSAGNGYWLGYNGGNAQFRVGQEAGNRLEFDGATNTIRMISGNVSIEPGYGITVKSAPGSTFPLIPSYGYNVTDRTYGGTCGMWGWEASLVRRLELSNETTSASNAAAAMRLYVLGFGGAGTQSGSLELESYASQQSLCKVSCGDVQLGWTGSNRLTFKGGSAEPFWFHTGGGAGGHLLPGTNNLQDLGGGSNKWRNINIGTFLESLYGLFCGGGPTHYVKLGADSAGKPTSSTWDTSSDRRAKDEITEVDPDAALALVRRVPLVRFRYNGEFGTPKGDRGIGVVAQDVQALMPASVKRDFVGDGLSWNAHELFMLNVAAVQALAARVETLETRM